MSNNTSQVERTKDPMITTKSVNQSLNSKGGKRTTFSFSQEETIKLIEALTALAENARGVKLDTHITKKVSGEGREFDSGIVFVKGISDPVQTAQAKFAPKAQEAFDVKAKLAALKAQQAASAGK